jgi:hypothetical protein
MKLYKLTDNNNKTRPMYDNAMTWGENVTNKTRGPYNRLCTQDVIHAYEDPRVAVIMMPVHVCFDRPKLWEAEGDVVARDGQLKVGVKSLTTIKEIPLPKITDEQKIRIAIFCVLEGSTDDIFIQWANKWLSGEDRTTPTAISTRLHVDSTAAHDTISAAVNDNGYMMCKYVAWSIQNAVKCKGVDLVAIIDRVLAW